MNHGTLSSAADQATALSYPVKIAREFLSVISNLPTTAIEAHGPSMELKIYEIASSVTDAIVNSSANPLVAIERPRDILHQLYRILSSCRGGNEILVEMLRNRIPQVQIVPQLSIEPSVCRAIEDVDDTWMADHGPFSSFTSRLNRLEGSAVYECEGQLQLGEEEFSESRDRDQQAAKQRFQTLPWQLQSADGQVQAPASPRSLYEQPQNFGGGFDMSNSDPWDPLPDGMPDFPTASPVSQLL